MGSPISPSHIPSHLTFSLLPLLLILSPSFPSNLFIHEIFRQGIFRWVTVTVMEWVLENGSGYLLSQWVIFVFPTSGGDTCPGRAGSCLSGTLTFLPGGFLFLLLLCLYIPRQNISSFLLNTKHLLYLLTPTHPHLACTVCPPFAFSTTTKTSQHALPSLVLGCASACLACLPACHPPWQRGKHVPNFNL